MSWKIREAVRHIGQGGVVAYPTETIYGLGCDPLNAAAVLHLLALKQRGIEPGLVLVAADFSQFEPLLLPVSSATRKRVEKPATIPTTWILPCLPDVPAWLRGTYTSLAVRVTTHPLAAALCDHWGGPLVSTSANIHNRRPASGPLSVRKIFDDRLDYILHGTPGSGRASTIRDGLTGKTLRTG